MEKIEFQDKIAEQIFPQLPEVAHLWWEAEKAACLEDKPTFVHLWWKNKALGIS